jgi:hypothetical protein
MAERPGDTPPFCVLLRPDYAGKSSPASKARTLGAPGDWSRYLDPSDPLNPLHHRDAYICEGNVLATATVERFAR